MHSFAFKKIRTTIVFLKNFMMIPKKILINILGAAIVSGGIADSATASSTYLSTSDGGIGIINTSSGVFSPFIKNSQIFFDIAVSKDNNLFGSAYQQFYSINQSTNSVSLIGNFSPFINALDFSGDNVLYGAGDSSFYTINLLNGATSLVANIPNFNSSGDLVFEPVNNRFLATSYGVSSDSLFSIALDGKANQIGNIGFKNVNGLLFDQGTLFGYTDSNQQIIIDPLTGIGTLNKNVMGATGSIYGAASSPLNESKSVPTPIPPLPAVPSSIESKSIPEPSFTLAILLFSAWGVRAKLKRIAVNPPNPY